jgi:predicted alpha-1,2-mannosidase
MVSVSPHNSLSSPSGYFAGRRTFYGFGHVHLSGTGCADLGSIIVTASRGTIHTSPEEYGSAFTGETASAGYYAAILEQEEILAEATASIRCGITRFTPRSDGKLNILIDAGRCLSIPGGGSVNIVTPADVEGYNIAGGFCGESNRERVYFVAQFSIPSSASGTWHGPRVGAEARATAQDSAVGCWFTFPAVAYRPVSVKVGVSYVSIENARRNLETEIPAWDFDRVRADASAAWNDALGRITLEGGSHDDFVRFYTALYHALIHPNVISDVNGEFPLMGRGGTGRYAARDRYSVFSLWDTYRTVHPLLTLLFPERQSAMVQTMVDMYKESGWLPKWELAGNETHMMVGDPVALVLADTYVKGVRDFDAATALRALLKSSAGDTAALPMRPGYPEYLAYHYMPFEQDTSAAWWTWGPVSTTLEYCFSDWAIAQLAGRLGASETANRYGLRAQYYRS